MNVLTPAEHETLNAAIAIIEAHTARNATWMIHPRRSETRVSTSVTYFDSAKRQHSDLWKEGCTFADKIEMGLEREAGIPSPEALKAERIQKLQAELAALTDAPLTAEAA